MDGLWFILYKQKIKIVNVKLHVSVGGITSHMLFYLYSKIIKILFEVPDVLWLTLHE